ncbi:pyridoxamine 5'-phosphate oxidase family protein [Zhengella sp. ZM62]|uniref:pyridoxamine 5'-phosphate oxidase family protein n=1 Tax=Zhengella sedimenti TaxID=3390035 RepID=UPI003976DCE1
MTKPAWHDDIDAFSAHCRQVLADAASKPDLQPRLMQVATIGADGAPRLRTVMLRSVEEDGWQITFHTDATSSKAAELAADPRLEIHVWRQDLQLMLRLRGRASLIHPPDPLVLAAWRQLAEHSRHVYRLTAPQGQPIDDAGAYGRHEPPLEGAGDPGLARFTVVSVRLDEIEGVSLEPAGHRRAIWQAPGSGRPDRWLVP